MSKPKKEQPQEATPPAQENTKMAVVSWYYGVENEDLICRMKALCHTMSGGGRSYSLSALITVACAATIDDLEKYAPVKRRFTLNGKEVIT